MEKSKVNKPFEKLVDKMVEQYGWESKKDARFHLAYTAKMSKENRELKTLVEKLETEIKLANKLIKELSK